MKRRILAIGAATALLVSLTACGDQEAPVETGTAGSDEHILVLADGDTTLDGQGLTEEGAVTLSHDIVYYESGHGSEYGEGTAEEAHSAEEAAAHTVVTIREPGTYRVSGTLSPGQLAVDLGEGAEDDPEAVVTLILDGADVTCTVAPALIFYHVYECGSADEPSATVDTSDAGARVILADQSENIFTGSHVARIYEEGTTDKLHKYDGAFYSKMSMDISGQEDDTGVLEIVADNEGLDSELHLTINGGVIRIQAQNDGINTNEDGVSVTTINGGTVEIDAGLGAEGDGIDSNGYLVINGGTVRTTANETSPDGGIDADCDILLNGGTLIAMGTRNDAVAQASGQSYMELSFASTLPAGSEIALAAPDGTQLLSTVTERACSSLTFSSPDLEQGVDYVLTVDGVTQQYTGHQSGGFGGRGPAGGMEQIPEGLSEWLETAQDVPDDIRAWLESVAQQQQERPDPPEGGAAPGEQGGTPPDGGTRPEAPGDMSSQETGEPSTAFTLSEGVTTFSGITDSAQDSGKTAVTFTADLSVGEDGTVSLSNIQADQPVDEEHVQISVADVPSEDYAASCLLSDGAEALAGILPSDPGRYQLTIAVTQDGTYTGSTQFEFTIPDP